MHRPQAEEDDDRHKQLITAGHLKALPLLIRNTFSVFLMNK